MFTEQAAPSDDCPFPHFYASKGPFQFRIYKDAEGNERADVFLSDRPFWNTFACSTEAGKQRVADLNAYLTEVIKALTPATHEQAEMMVRLGQAWLETNHPDVLAAKYGKAA